MKKCILPVVMALAAMLPLPSVAQESGGIVETVDRDKALTTIQFMNYLRYVSYEIAEYQNIFVIEDEYRNLLTDNLNLGKIPDETITFGIARQQLCIANCKQPNRCSATAAFGRFNTISRPLLQAQKGTGFRYGSNDGRPGTMSGAQSCNRRRQGRMNWVLRLERRKVNAELHRLTSLCLSRSRFRKVWRKLEPLHSFLSLVRRKAHFGLVKRQKMTEMTRKTRQQQENKMTAALLLAAQVALHADIKAHAIELGYDSAKVEPIYDGVVDAEAYLASKPRIMWILKEPYDDFDAKGHPQGGGWTMFKDFGADNTLANAVNRNAANRTLRSRGHHRLRHRHATGA